MLSHFYRTLSIILMVQILVLPSCRNRNTTEIKDSDLTITPFQSNLDQEGWFKSVEPEQQEKIKDVFKKLDQVVANENWLFMIAGTEEEPILHPYTSGSLQNIMKKRIEEAKITNNTSTRIFPMIYLFMALPSQEKTEGRADELQSYLAFQITPTEDAFDAKTNKLKFLVQTFLANTAWSKLMSNSFPESSLIKQKNATIFELNLNLTNEEEIKNHIAKQLEKMSALTMRVMSFKDGVKYGALQQANVKLGAYTMAILGATLAMLAVGILCGNLGYLSGQQYEIVSDNPIRAVWQAIPKKQRNAVVYFSSMAIVLAAVSLLFYFKATPPPQNIKLDDPQK